MNKPYSISTAPSAPTAETLMKGSARMKAKDVFYKVGTGIDRAIFNASKRRIFGKAFGMPLVELVTTGRRSGKERSTMLSVPIVDSDRLVLVASFGGDDRYRAWYLNLQANPEVRTRTAGSTRTMIARTATEEERADLFQACLSYWVASRLRGLIRFVGNAPVPFHDPARYSRPQYSHSLRRR